MELELVELFFLRSLVLGRITELKDALNNPRTNFAANEALDIYDPIFSKLDSEIESVSTKMKAL
jgi:hypothetical protein